MKVFANIYPHEALRLWRDTEQHPADLAAKLLALTVADYYSIEAERTLPTDETRVRIDRVTAGAIPAGRWGTGQKAQAHTTIGKAIGIMRRRVGMGMLEAAKRLAVSTRTMVAVEGDLREPSGDLLKKVLNMFRDISIVFRDYRD